LRSGPFEGPAIVKPPALPGDTYSISEELALTDTVKRDLDLFLK